MAESGASARVGGEAAADPIRVMIVDDALVIRGMLTRMLEEADDISVVATAGDGEKALAKLKRTDVDIVVLDIEMPVMDGIETLPKIKADYPDIEVVMASTLTQRNAEISIRAMQLGAADYIPKPSSSGELRSADQFKQDLKDKIRTLGRAARRKARKAGRPARPAPLPTKSDSAAAIGRSRTFTLRPFKPFKPTALAIGSSTGGPQALLQVLKELGAVDQPVFITQHMPPTFTTILAQHIARSTGRPCSEGEDGATVQAGHIYLAPGNKHMLLKPGRPAPTIRLTEDPPENFCRPAVDPMLRSLAAVYGNKLMIAILTGMGSDGAKGARHCVDAGAQVIAQDEETSVVWGMPGAAAVAGVCGAVLPLPKIGGALRRILVDGAAP
jgi:two-component system chemotaxis response regulator CheB